MVMAIIFILTLSANIILKLNLPMKLPIIIGTVLLFLGSLAVFSETGFMMLLYGPQIIVEKVESFAESSKGNSERRELNRKTAKIRIDWTDNLEGDFSFKDKWRYEDATMFSIMGKDSLSIPLWGIDDELIELCEKWAAKEDELEENLKHFLTHYPYTLKTNYTFGVYGEIEQLDFMLAQQINSHRVECQSSGIILIANIAGMAALNLNIVGNLCYPVIGFDEEHKGSFLQRQGYSESSYTPSPFSIILPCKEGSITIDKTYWDEGWLKASFSFVFDNADSGDFTISGKIFTPIKYKMINGEPFMAFFNNEPYNYCMSLRRKY